MPEPDERFLNVGYEGFRLHPGPVDERALISTLDVAAFEEYSYGSIARSILSFPGTRETHTKSPGWPYWAATWKEDDRYIRLDFMPDEDHFLYERTGEPYWSGCNIECDCLVRDLVGLWETVRARHPGVWLYVGEELLSPQGFLKSPSSPAE